MIGYLKALNIEGLNLILDKVFDKFVTSSATPENIKNICGRLIVIAVGCIEEMGIDIYNNLGVSFNPFKEVEKFSVLEDMNKWLKALFEKMVILIQDNKTSKFKGIIKIVLKHIEENYQKDLSLIDISGIVYVTPNYISRIFKEEMNVNFVEYLNQFRVEKAKAFLLETGSKTYEVAEKVGYRDYKYFSYIFKKFTGCTPREFKEKGIQ